MNAWALEVWNGSGKVATAGGIFDPIDAEAVQERLRQAPGQEARVEFAPVADKPAPTPTRWTLRIIRVSIPALHDYSLSGVWRVLQRCECELHSPKLHRFSPDEEYASKQARLLHCLRQVREQQECQTLVFLDEMGYYR